jgi:hypothetical protein
MALTEVGRDAAGELKKLGMAVKPPIVEFVTANPQRDVGNHTFPVPQEGLHPVVRSPPAAI